MRSGLLSTLIGGLLLVVPSSSAAQTVTATTGAINGTITDSTRAVLPGVTVTLSGPAIMGAPAAVTDQSGLYRFSAVPPGDYKLVFELSGSDISRALIISRSAARSPTIATTTTSSASRVRATA